MAGGLAGAAFVLYAVTACRTVSFGDAGELIAASARWGLAHPPGYPLYTSLAGLALMIPAGEPALRTTLLSALCAAATCGVLGVWAARAWGSRPGGVAAAGAFAVNGIVWSFATVTEVYTLHTLFVAVLLAAAWSAGAAPDPRERRRALYAGAIALGAGLAHHPTIVLAVPSAALLAWSPRRREAAGLAARDLLGAAALAIAIPAALDATLWLRARHDPGAWGGVGDLRALIDHVAARRYRVYDMGWDGVLRPEGWTRLAALLAAGSAGLGLLAAASGLLAPWRDRGAGDRRLRGALAVLALAAIAFSLRYATEDVEAYLLPAVIAVAMLQGRAVAALAARLPAAARGRFAAATAVLLIAAPFLANLRANDRSGERSARLYAEDMLATLPPRSILFVDGDNGFLLAYATQVLRERADLVLHDRGGVLFAPYLDAARPDESRDAWVMRREIEIASREAGRADGRPVFFMTWPGYELPQSLRFEPEGLFYRVVAAASPPPDDAALWAGYHVAAIEAAAGREPGAFPAVVAATYRIMRGEEAMARGREDGARAAFDAAVAVAPDSETILNAVGTVWARHGRYRDAARWFERATRALPTSLRAWANLAQARMLMGDAAGAEAAAARARSIEAKVVTR